MLSSPSSPSLDDVLATKLVRLETGHCESSGPPRARSKKKADALGEVLPPLSQNQTIRMLRKTSPAKQETAINILLQEERVLHKKIKTLSPKELAKQGHVQYNLTVKSVTDGATPEMKVVRLACSKTPGSIAGGIRSNRHLKIGAHVSIFKQYENPQDKTLRKTGTHFPSQRALNVTGMVSEVGPNHCDIVIDVEMQKLLPKGTVQLESVQTLQVYLRMLHAVRLFRSSEKRTQGDVPFLADVVRGRVSVKISEDLAFDTTGLNASQRRAIAYSLGSDISVIKGPPGTGKSLVLYRTILELVRRKETVLICCASHAAIDNLLKRLNRHSNEFGIDRLGHPHRISPSLRHLSVHVQRHSRRSPRKKMVPTKVVAATLHAAWKLLQYEPIDTIVIDEVCQGLQAQCWIPLISCATARRLVIAGDDKQLPPVITTEDKRALDTLGVSLFDAALACYGSKILHLLDTQYRMSEVIMRFPANYMYGGLLLAHDKNATQRLHHVKGVKSSPTTMLSLLWIDTSSLGHTEKSRGKGLISNPTEARLVKDHCQKLQRQGVRLGDIGVISPYNHQKNLIKKTFPAIEVNTVDAYQGQEKNVIVLSLVRSNGAASVGFLSDERRLNVAMTRAKYQLCVVGDMSTLENCNSPMLQRWIPWCREHATIVKPYSQA